MENQIAQADFVLVVCTKQYLDRYELKDRPGYGLGATWEGVLTRQHLYESQGRNTKFIPVVFDSAARQSVPTPLRPYTCYELPAEVESLCRHLTKQPRVVPTPLGGAHMPAMPAAPQSGGEGVMVRSAAAKDKSRRSRSDILDTVDRFYDLFLENSQESRVFKIRLIDGSELVGVPMAGSMFNPSDPNAAFSLFALGRNHRVPFSELADAVPLDNGRTGGDVTDHPPDERVLHALSGMVDQAGIARTTEKELREKLGPESERWDLHGIMLQLKGQGAFANPIHFESGGPDGAYFLVRVPRRLSPLFGDTASHEPARAPLASPLSSPRPYLDFVDEPRGFYGDLTTESGERRDGLLLRMYVRNIGKVSLSFKLSRFTAAGRPVPLEHASDLLPNGPPHPLDLPIDVSELPEKCRDRTSPVSIEVQVDYESSDGQGDFFTREISFDVRVEEFSFEGWDAIGISNVRRKEGRRKRLSLGWPLADELHKVVFHCDRLDDIMGRQTGELAIPGEVQVRWRGIFEAFALVMHPWGATESVLKDELMRVIQNQGFKTQTAPAVGERLGPPFPTGTPFKRILATLERDGLVEFVAAPTLDEGYLWRLTDKGNLVRKALLSY